MLTYELDRTSNDPLYQQLYKHIRDDIESGSISAEERLPSKRAIARHLAVSVMTVEGAYAQLTAEGYVRTEPRRGFFACKVNESVGGGYRQPAQRRRTDTHNVAADTTGALPTSNGESTSENLLADLTGAQAPEGIFPYTSWARTMRKVLSDESEQTLMRASNTRGSYELRCAIADHLHGYRGMDVHPDQIVIGSGAQSLYGLAVQLLGRNRIYAFEDPGYPRLASTYHSNDVATATIGLDQRGPLVNELERSGASVFHCMPSHQFPTGITTAVGRRRELLAWANGGDNESIRYLIEDDYDCEFRMEGKPVPPLYSLDGNERVIYTNTFTKTLGSAFRIGYMVLPAHLAQRFEDQLGFYLCPVGALEQLTLTRFIASGDYERHINRQRTHFRKLQTRLIKELEQADERHVMQFENVGAGLHFVLKVKDVHESARAYEQAVVKQAREMGVALAPMQRYNLSSKKLGIPAFVISFASLKEDVIPEVAKAIAASL